MKLRMMFTQNRHVPILEEYQIGNDYFMLYYQFIKHAFGLQFAVPEGGTASAAVLLDDVPHAAEKFHQFKEYLSSLSAFPKWSRAGFSIAYSEIANVNSKQHNILQALDVVLGGVQSRLNEKHTKPQPPAKRHGKRTRAKARVYDAIKARIQRIYPNSSIRTSMSELAQPLWKAAHAFRASLPALAVRAKQCPTGPKPYKKGPTHSEVTPPDPTEGPTQSVRFQIGQGHN